MNVQEYKQLLLDDFTASAEANQTSPSQEFIFFVVDMFNDTEEVYDMIPCYFQGVGQNGRKILIDGYAYEESDKSYTFFVSKFDMNKDLITITQTEIDGYVKAMSAFVENALSRYIQKNTDISCEGNQVADTLWRRYNAGAISKFKFYILTNSILSERVKTIKDKNLLEKTVEINVWDIQRFYNTDVNNRQKEPIYIDICKYCDGKGIPAIKAFDDGEEYTSYLAVIPGELLATIYDEFGSRLLEGNVRSFLSASGKVNKGIKETILKTPKYFFTYNNGIATTASNIETRLTDNGLEITAIKGATADITNEKVKEEVISILKKNKVKVICGGFPCQGFSNSGTCVASDPRNVLYKDMLEIVAKVKPDYIVMENVLGILSMLDGKVVDTILSDYESIGYKITYKIMNSVNYGVPQNRERVIFIGNRAGKNNYFPNKVLSRKFKTVQETIEKYGNIENPNINHIFSKHSVAMQNRLANVPLGGHLYSNYSDSWRKTYPGKPSCTIKENHGATNIHYMYPRTMSPREIAALQSFPDDFIFIGTKATILKQIGNAVPPLMAKAIALAIKKALKE